ncbi:hypothetical protein DEA06_10090 [Microbacterium sp. Gd 4-13]|uniref:hypothetical protein n=1 Tax=Microbacterium sp. Gd 4-13 TaxID=2173179 RepID=UPI000D584E10|nr:hypothetical protein [Microbacterium sp. Gd 4-13]PVW04356.1 hypothetical protein DEA06_10090 [Microbacterium sp. Gd 4-13]
MTSDAGPSDDAWVYVPSSALPDPETYTDLGAVIVDGETFGVRRRESDGSHHYNWISGPNPGYGFSVSGGGAPVGEEWHVRAIRDFLAGIDPATGYLSGP